MEVGVFFNYSSHKHEEKQMDAVDLKNATMLPFPAHMFY